MAAIPGQLDAQIGNSSRRAQDRRKLRLKAQGNIASDQASVTVLDISTSGLLLKTDEELGVGETIEIYLPGANEVSAIVRWSRHGLFGCQFIAPVSDAFVSAALLRSPPMPAVPGLISGPDLDNLDEDGNGLEGKLSGRARIYLLLALMVGSWAVIAGVLLAF